jgi:four helix bundle protein
MNQSTTTMKSFHGLRTYDLALELYGKCEQIKARHHIKDQLLRARLSIVLNISEGTGKPTLADRKRFYAIALGSLRETQCLLEIVRHPECFELAHRLGGHLYRLVHPK